MLAVENFTPVMGEYYYEMFKNGVGGVEKCGIIKVVFLRRVKEVRRGHV